MKIILTSILILFTNWSLACDANLTIQDLSFDWSSRGQVINTSFTVDGTSDFSCYFRSFLVTFSKGNANSYNRKLTHAFGETVDYNFYKDSSATQVLKDAQDIQTTNDTIVSSHSFWPRTLNYYSKLSPPTNGSAPLVRGGLYNDSVQVSVYTQRNNNRYELSARNSISVSTFVPKVVDISLVDQGAPFNINDTEQTLDFGELEKNEELSFDLRVRSNAGYMIFFDSINSGVMKNEVNGDEISYDLKIDGKKKKLPTSKALAESNGVTPEEGNAHTVSVKIGNVNNKQSGLYTDYITITAMTIE
ncbi:spore coat protein U domain-containing protein [Halobacteriovorax sp. GB3]|uniref:spore coat protein U domain-containing protein n=1 Tax=Halobacteriovorax sp. GB3 TaxID=2719615 RepID=UPI00235EB3E5|nr:spore coat protein U domain-containing protein [Halobacteriovorax sp. GB3]MDD0851840.1 spore coat protein U domain-containing protein [Halobacteriovorax sp. GB3]